MIERRWRRDPPPLWAPPLASVLAALLVFPAVMVLFQTQTQLTDDRRGDPVLAYALIAVAAGIVAGVSAWLVHWGIEYRLMCRTLRQIVLGALCPRCKHPLAGLPIYDDAHRPEDQSRKRVRCPECGKVVRLLKYGFSPQDLASWDQRVLPKGFEVRLKDGQWG